MRNSRIFIRIEVNLNNKTNENNKLKITLRKNITKID